MNGFSSTLVTVHGRRRIKVSRNDCASFSPSSLTVVRFELALAVEILAGRDALAADLRERGPELHRAAAQLRFEIQYLAGREREAFFLASTLTRTARSARGPR